jgi:hypothetical protein
VWWLLLIVVLLVALVFAWWRRRAGPATPVPFSSPSPTVPATQVPPERPLAPSPIPDFEAGDPEATWKSPQRDREPEPVPVGRFDPQVDPGGTTSQARIPDSDLGLRCQTNGHVHASPEVARKCDHLPRRVREALPRNADPRRLDQLVLEACQPRREPDREAG